MHGAFQEAPDGSGTLLHLKVVPGASKSHVAGLHGDRLKIRVAAPPEGGKANRAVIRLLAEHLDVATRTLTIVQGLSSPLKTVSVEGVSPTVVEARLATL